MICKYCNKDTFKSEKSFIAHQVSCKQNPNRKVTILSENSKDLIGKKLRGYAIEKYNLNPKLCQICNGVISYERKRYNKTCSDNCKSIMHTQINLLRYQNPEYQIKRNISLSNTLKNKIYYNYKKDLIIQYRTVDYTRIYKNVCKHCGLHFILNTQRKYCNEHKDLYNSNGRNLYLFTFNVYHYEDLFDLQFLKNNKWRCSKTNPNGVTRDHKVSINEAIRNNYDPYYIKHPLNCELMVFDENNKKKTNSSITYKELVLLVDDYDSKSGAPGKT